VLTNKGFTLIELLVVLVVTALTTTLLMTGLNTTWKNFDKLSSRNLIFSQAQIPKSWFIESIRGALLSHPDIATFSGTDSQITMVSFLAPDSSAIPKPLIWEVREQNGNSVLGIIQAQSQYKAVLVFNEPVHFEFLIEHKWVKAFNPKTGQLPRAVRIQGDQTQILASVYRPTNADMPAELIAFGEYEF